MKRYRYYKSKIIGKRNKFTYYRGNPNNNHLDVWWDNKWNCYTTQAMNIPKASTTLISITEAEVMLECL